MKSRYDRQRENYAARERAAGRPMRVPYGPAQERRNLLRSLGLTDTRIAELATENGYPMHQSTVSTIGNNKNVHRDTEAGVFSIDPETVEECPHKLVPLIGIQRAIGGLMHAGYSLNWLSLNGIYEKTENCPRPEDRNHSYAHNLMSPNSKFKYVELRTFRRVYAFALKLELVDPRDMGLKAYAIGRARNYAAKRGYAPLSCWDEDTILDPDAFPEWTGECGTVTGYYLHRKHRVHVKVTGGTDTHSERVTVLCAPCCEARSRAKADGRSSQAMIAREAVMDMLRAGRTDYDIMAAEAGTSRRTVDRIRKAGEWT